MCLLSKKAQENPGAIESVAEEWAWRQLDVFNHGGDIRAVVVRPYEGYDVIDPWIAEDAQFAEPWPDHEGEHAVANPWEHYGREWMDAFVRDLFERWGTKSLDDIVKSTLAQPRRTLADVQAGDVITYVGDSLAFGGDYEVVREADTYVEAEDAAQPERLMICEFMNDGTPMFIPVEELDESDWEISE